MSRIEREGVRINYANPPWDEWATMVIGVGKDAREIPVPYTKIELDALFGGIVADEILRHTPGSGFEREYSYSVVQFPQPDTWENRKETIINVQRVANAIAGILDPKRTTFPHFERENELQPERRQVFDILSNLPNVFLVPQAPEGTTAAQS